jgi:MoaA/NifB/PqqE/SkfB family radical SAM enzyme
MTTQWKTIDTTRIKTPLREENNTSKHLNELSLSGLKIDLVTPRCNRARLDTGPFCNYDCEFCYYKDILDVKTPWEVIKQRIDYLYDYGITEIDLSGGESSVSQDWLKILDYCNEKFEHVSCLSHGGRFADMDFLKESQDHGLKEILFSLHGATEETHDSITNRKGSFKRIIQAIKNAQQLGIIVRLNSTIYTKNYHQLEHEHAELINDINPLEVNFITLNYWGEYSNIEFNNVGYSEMTDGIKRCIDKLNSNIIINVRYVPYCYMVGYEQYVVNQFQHIYSIRDWNKEIQNQDIDVTKKYNDEEKINFAYSECARQRQLFYRKDLSCLKCKYFYICDGVEKELHGHTDLNPESGEKIQDVNHYLKSRTDRWNSQY